MEPRIINIIKDPHFATRSEEKGWLLRYCEYKMFYLDGDGVLYVLSFINDDDLRTPCKSLEGYLMSSDVPIDTELLKEYIAGENSLYGCDEETARRRVYDELRKNVGSPLITDEVREILTGSKVLNGSKHITELGLSGRVLGALKGVGILTLDDLLRVKKIALLKLRNIGKKSIHEINEFYERNGYEWGTEDLEAYWTGGYWRYRLPRREEFQNE